MDWHFKLEINFLTIKCYRVILGFVSSNSQLVSVSNNFYRKTALHLIYMYKLSCSHSIIFFQNQIACIMSEMPTYMCEESKVLLFVASHISMSGLLFIGPKIIFCGNLILWEYEMEWLKQSLRKLEQFIVWFHYRYSFIE